MNKKTPEKINPKFILERIEKLRRIGVPDDLVIEIERLAARCVSRDAIGGGCNDAGHRLRYRCPTCGSVIKGPQYNIRNAEDYICSNCKQHINWFGDWFEDDEDDENDEND